MTGSGPIKLVDTTLRDGNQSLWGATGLTTGMMLQIAPAMNRAGFKAVDFTTSTHMAVAVRFQKENPWERIRLMAEAMPDSPLSFLHRNAVYLLGNRQPQPDGLRLRIAGECGHPALCHHGPDERYRRHDAHGWAGAKAGVGDIIAAITYTVSPIHDDAHFAGKAKELAKCKSFTGLYLKDPGGLLTPERARTIIPALKAQTGKLPLELHSHASIGLAQFSYLEAAALGADYYEQLAAAGLPFAPGRILTPASVAAHHLGALGLKKILLIAAEGVLVPVEAAGIATCAPGDPLTGVEAVLIGWQPDFSRKELDAVCTAIWAGAAFFATSLAPYFASANGRMIGISGAISAMVTSVTGKKPALLGKPGPIGLKMAASVLKASVASLVVVGDDPKLEILMARRGKAHAIGVTTGENDRAAFMALPEHQRAHEIYASLPEAMASRLFPAAAKPSAKRKVLA